MGQEVGRGEEQDIEWESNSKEWARSDRTNILVGGSTVKRGSQRGISMHLALGIRCGYLVYDVAHKRCTCHF